MSAVNIVRTSLNVIGALAIVVGLLWVAQGTGLIAGALIDDETGWAVRGVGAIISGFVLIVLAKQMESEEQT